MSQENPPIGNSSSDLPATPPRKRRRWLKVLAAVLVLVLLLLILLPTLAGLGFVRGIIVGKINQNLDGKLQIDDWSLGWNSGIVMRGIHLFDDRGEKLAVIDKVSTQLSLLNAIRGKYELGKTSVEGCEFWLKLDKQGQSNVARIPKKKKEKPAEPQTAETSLPDFSGEFSIDAKGQIERPDTPIAKITSAKITATVTGVNDPLVQHADIETVLGNSSPGQIIIDSKLRLTALLNVANKKAPGSTGVIDVNTTLPNLQAIVTQLTSAVQLLPDVTITGGEFKQSTHIEIREKDLAIANRVTLTADGQRGGAPIKLDRVDISKADLTFDPTRDAISALGNIALDIKSPFLTVQGGGTPGSGLNIPGTFNLDELSKQLSQFFDLSKIKLSGKGAFNLTSSGDVTSSALPVKTSATVTVDNLALAFPDMAPVLIAKLNLVSEAQVTLSTNQIQLAHIALETGDGKNTIIDTDITASGIDVASMNVKHFDVNKLNVMDLATAQLQIDPFLPALRANGVRIAAGQLYTNVSGSIDGRTRTIKFDQGNPLVLSTPGLTVQKVGDDGKSVNLVSNEQITAKVMGEMSLPPIGPTSASIKTLDIHTQSDIFKITKSEGSDLTFKMDDTSIAGAGSVTLSADVKAIKEIAQRFGGTVEVKTGSAGELTSGRLDATLAISHGQTPETIVQLDGAITNVSVTTADPKKPITNETVKLALKATAKDDMSGASASANVDSAFANLSVKGAELSLKTKSLEKAQVEVSAPDLAKLDVIVIAFMPPPAPADVKEKKNKKSREEMPAAAAAPAPAIQITAGSATLTLNVARDPSAAAGSIASLRADGLLTVPAATVSGMEIQNLLVPIFMDEGMARTVYKDKPNGKNTAPPAICSGGTMDLGNIACDLTTANPRISMAKNHRLLHNVSINPVLGDTLGKYVNPVFANSKRAAGVLDVTVTECKGLALGDKLMSDDSGNLRVVFSLSDMDIANPFGALLLGGLVRQLGAGDISTESETFQGLIKDAVVSLEKGRADTDITLSLIDPSVASVREEVTRGKAKPTVMPMTFKGYVDLDTLQQRISATIPPQLLGKFVRALPIPGLKDPTGTLVQIFPDGIPVSIKGTTTSPQFDYENVGKKFAAGALKNPEKINEIGKSIFDQINGQREKKNR